MLATGNKISFSIFYVLLRNPEKFFETKFLCDDFTYKNKNYVLALLDYQQFFEPRVWLEDGIISPLVLQLNQMDFQIDLICMCLHADSQ